MQYCVSGAGLVPGQKEKVKERSQMSTQGLSVLWHLRCIIGYLAAFASRITLFYSQLSIGFPLQHMDSDEYILTRSEIMHLWSNEAEQRDLWVLAVPRRQEGVHRSDWRDQSNAKKIRELAPYARWMEVALELKI